MNVDLYFQNFKNYGHVVSDYKIDNKGEKIVKGKEEFVEGRGSNKELGYSSEMDKNPPMSTTKGKDKLNE